jgi:lysophospholipase L1-like esterase
MCVVLQRRTRESTRQYANIVANIARANLWNFVDMWNTVAQTPEYCNTMLQPDGLHLSANGQNKLFQLIRNHISSEIRDMR